MKEYNINSVLYWAFGDDEIENILVPWLFALHSLLYKPPLNIIMKVNLKNVIIELFIFGFLNISGLIKILIMCGKIQIILIHLNIVKKMLI